MINAILADDEPIIVKGLNKLIDWEKMGIKIVGTASNGTEALELLRKKKPDLLISDINMPGLSGIELLKILNSENSETKVIFISGFHEFEYAHAAVKYGAIDYLLKPINEVQLKSALSKALKTSRLGTEDIAQEIQSKSSPELPDMGPGFYSIVQVCIDYKEFSKSTEKEQNIISFSAVNLIRDYFEEVEKNHFIVERDNNLFIMYYHTNKEQLNFVMKRHSKQIIIIIKEKLGQRLIVAAGKSVDGFNFINEAIRTSQETIKNRFFYDGKELLHYKNTMIKRYSLEDLYTRQERLLEAITKCTSKPIDEATNSYLKVLKDVTFGNKGATISFCLGAVVSLKKNLEADNIQLNILELDDQTFLNEAYKLFSYDELFKWFHSHVENIYLEFQSYKDSKTHPEIDKIKKYIESHFSENIRLQDLADLVYLHPNYLSGHFKKYTGQNFKDYLTDVRMAEAEKLLTTSDLKVYEIAEHVGFTDYRHFSEVFKRKFGQSPRNFKS
ncbi:MAG: response regulator [Spirochaetaceae bacterium]